MVRVLVVVALVGALMAADAPAGAGNLGGPVYALSQADAGEGHLLSRRDPLTLAVIGPVAHVGNVAPVEFSPDGSLLAFLGWMSDTPIVRVLDLSRMGWRAQVSLGLAGHTVVVRWLDSERLLALVAEPDGLRVFVFNTTLNRITAVGRIAGHLAEQPQVAVSRSKAAILLRAKPKLGPVRVAVVSATASRRTVTLTRIREGAINRAGPDGRDRWEIYRPSLVADPTMDRAYVVGGLGEPVAAINLRTLAVSYQRPFPPLAPSSLTGAERMTAWLGDGRFAVAGWDTGPPGSDSRLLGLRVVDTRSWQTQTLDPNTDLFCVAGHSLVGHHLDGSLAVFGFDGRLELTLPDGALFPTPVTSNDHYLYVPDPGTAHVLVADLVSGTPLGESPVEPGLDLLISPAQPLGAGCT